MIDKFLSSHLFFYLLILHGQVYIYIFIQLQNTILGQGIFTQLDFKIFLLYIIFQVSS